MSLVRSHGRWREWIVLFGSYRHKLFQLTDGFGNKITVFEIRLELVPLVLVVAFDKLLALVSQVEIDFYLFGQ
jgi:hypothetical protein